MTIEQKEQTILTLLGELPLFRRVRIAISIMKGIEPEQVLVEQQVGSTETFSIGTEAAETLLKRIQAYENGNVQGKEAFQALSDLKADLSSQS